MRTHLPAFSMRLYLLLLILLWIALPLDLDLYAVTARLLFLGIPLVLLRVPLRRSPGLRWLTRGGIALLIWIALDVTRAMLHTHEPPGKVLQVILEGLLPWWYSLWHHVPLLAPSQARWLDRSTFVAHLFGLSPEVRSSIVYALGWWPASLVFPFYLLTTWLKEEAETPLRWTPLLSGLAAALWVMAVQLTGDLTHMVAGRPMGPGVPVDLLAESLALGVLISVFQVFQRQVPRNLYLLPGIVMFAGLLLIRSLGLLLATVGGLTCYLGLRRHGLREKRRMGLLILAAVLGLFLLPKTRQALRYFLRPGHPSASPLIQRSFQPRWLRWKAAIRCAQQHPLLGCGSAGYFRQARQEALQTPAARGLQTELGIHTGIFKGMAGSLHATHAHNTFLDTLGRGGLVGFLLVGFWIFTLFAASAGASRRAEARAILVFLLIWSLTDDPFFFRWRLIPPLALWAWTFTLPRDR